MKKMVMGFAFICCLVLGVQTSLTKARAATNWKEYKTLTVKKGAFTFKAHPSSQKKEAWIYQVKVNSKKGSTKTLKFPSKIKGRKVTKLGWTEDMGEDNEFYRTIFGIWVEEAHDCDGYMYSLRKTQKLIIPKTVKELTNCCFRGLRALKQVTIPSGVKKIPRSAFYGCRKLKSVTLPKKLQEFDREVFADCPAISEMKLSKSNKTYKVEKGAVLSKDGKQLYWVLPAKKKYTISSKTSSIDTNALRDCKMKKLVLPAHVIDLKRYALYSKNIKKITVDTTNPVYAKDGQCIYKKATGELITVVVKNNKIAISSKVTILNENATMTGADNCAELERVDIPESVKTLETYWIFFHNLSTKVYFHSKTPPQINAIVPGWQYAAIPCFNPVYVPQGSKDIYEKWAEDHFRFDEKDVNCIGIEKLYTF